MRRQHKLHANQQVPRMSAAACGKVVRVATKRSLIEQNMTITLALTPDQETWLQAHVATGNSASIEEAVQRLIAERIAEERQRKKDRREVLRATDLSEEDIAAIAASWTRAMPTSMTS